MSDVNINPNSPNTVSIQNADNIITVTDDSKNTEVNLTEKITDVVNVVAIGPQGTTGPQGPAGPGFDTPFTGSVIISGSLTTIGPATFTSITSSGGISSSANITALSASFSHLEGNSPLVIGGLIDFQGEITQSSDVSASFGRLRVLKNAEFDTGIRNFYVDDVDGADIYQRIGTTTLNNLVLESSMYNTSVVSSHTASLLGQVTNVGATLGINATRSINLGVNNAAPAFNNLWNIYLGGGQSDTKLFIQSPTTQVTGTLFSGSAVTTASFGHYIGNGSGLINIPASGITGLNLSQIASGTATASISETNGLIVNTNTQITGSLTTSGSINHSGSVDINLNASSGGVPNFTPSFKIRSSDYSFFRLTGSGELNFQYGLGLYQQITAQDVSGDGNKDTFFIGSSNWDLTLQSAHTASLIGKTVKVQPTIGGEIILGRNVFPIQTVKTIIGGGQYANNTNLFIDTALTEITSSLNLSGSLTGNITSTASFGHYIGDGSGLTGLLSSSAQIASDISGAFNAPSSSFSTRVSTNESNITNLQTDSGSFSTRVSANETNITAITSSLTANRVVFTTTGGQLATDAGMTYDSTNDKLTVQSLNVVHLTSSFITASTIQTSGSNIFGDDTTDTQTLIGTTIITGSAKVTGSLNVSNTILGSNLSGTNTGDQDLSPYALKTAITGAFSESSSSFSTRITTNKTDISDLTSKTGSYATTGSNSFNGNQQITGSLIVSGAFEPQGNLGNSTSVVIGKDATASGNGISIGKDSSGNPQGVSIGVSSVSGQEGVSIGYESGYNLTTGRNINIGTYAQGRGTNSIMLSSATGFANTNNTAYSFGVYMTSNSTPDFQVTNTHITASGNISGSVTSTASFGTYLGDGSQLTGLGGAFGISDSSGSYTYYTSLSASMAAALSGDVVEVFADTIVSGSDPLATTILFKNGVNIFGNGHTYTLNHSSSMSAFADFLEQNDTDATDISCSINEFNIRRISSDASSKAILINNRTSGKQTSLNLHGSTIYSSEGITYNANYRYGTVDGGHFSGGIAGAGFVNNASSADTKPYVRNAHFHFPAGYATVEYADNCQFIGETGTYALNATGRISNCYIFSKGSISAGAGGSNAALLGCHVENGSSGIAARGFYRISDSTIISSTGFAVRTYGNANCELTNNRIYASGYVALDQYTSYSTGKHIISNNLIITDSTTYAACQLRGAPTNDFLFSNNTVFNRGDNANSHGVKLTNNGTSHQVYMANNTIKVFNAGANCITAAASVDAHLADNIYDFATTPVNTFVTQSFTNVPDAQGNIHVTSSLNNDRIYSGSFSGSYVGSSAKFSNLEVNGSSRTLFTTASLVYSGSNVTQVTQSYEAGTTQTTSILYSGSFADGNPLSISVTGSDGVSKLYTMEYSASLITQILVS